MITAHYECEGMQMHQTDIAMFAMAEDTATGFAWAMDGEGGSK
jgi:hypothetical protein